MSFESNFKNAGNDYDGALERAAGDTGLLMQLMTMFLADTAFSELKTALEANNGKSAFAAAHSLKGSSGMLGMTALFAAASQVTELLRAGETEAAKAVYPKVRIEYERITRIIGDAV